MSTAFKQLTLLTVLTALAACQSQRSPVFQTGTTPIRSGFSQQSALKQWQVQKGTPQPRYNLQANIINNEIYVSGGFNDRDILNTFERFNPQTQLWSALPAMPSPRYIHTASVLHQNLYVIGGYQFNASTASLLASLTTTPLQNAPERGAVATVDRYNPATQEWSPVAPLRMPRFMPMSVSHQGKIYVAGGGDAGRQMLDSIEVFDPAAQLWAQGEKLPDARAWGQLVSDGNFIYLIGGLNAQGQYMSRIDRYDTTQKTWQTNALPALPTGLAGFGAALTPQGLVVSGGTTPEGFKPETHVLNLKQPSGWQHIANMEPARAGLALVSTSQGLYAMGTDAWYTNNTLKLLF